LRLRRLVTAMAGACALCAACGGCRAPRRIEIRDAPPPVRTVSAGTLLLAWQEPGADGRVNPVLEVEAASGVVEQGTQSGTLRRASGRIYRHGVLRARFSAPVVDARMASHRLIAQGGVKVVSVAPAGLTLVARKVEWRTDLNRIVAYGGVTFVQRNPATGAVEAEGGPFDRVTVNTELQRLTIP